MERAVLYMLAIENNSDKEDTRHADREHYLETLPILSYLALLPAEGLDAELYVGLHLAGDLHPGSPASPPPTQWYPDTQNRLVYCQIKLKFDLLAQKKPRASCLNWADNILNQNLVLSSET